jgi:rhamnulokinase
VRRVLAVDLGASALRVAAVDLAGLPPEVRVAHRYPHAPVRAPDGTLRWDWERLVAEAVRGLELALADGPVESIGVDTWGVDYGLLDGAGGLVAPPFSYRDQRTSTWQRTAARLGEERLYTTTGIQLMPINTVFQLAVHDRAELGRAATLLMLPELLVHALTGAVTGERTSAGTTALVDVTTGDWSGELVDAVSVDRGLLPPIMPAGTAVGEWRGIAVHLVGGHDTASAVAALPEADATGAAFVSSGTWMLVGAERPLPDVSDAARAANFSNEPGVLGGVRFLKNVMGLWMVQQCLAAWGDPPLEPLLAAAERAGGRWPVVDATDERFLAPDHMPAEVRRAAGLPDDVDRAVIIRCVLASLAAATARVVDELESFLDCPVRRIHVMGGGARNTLLNRLIAEAAGRPVTVGATEATALGNALVQGIAIGAYADLPSARAAAR